MRTTRIGGYVLHSWRALARQPVISVAAVLSLGIGIGSVTAIASVVYGVVLRPLPYDNPEELAVVWQNDRLRETEKEGASVPDFYDWQEQQESFSHLMAYVFQQANLMEADVSPEQIGCGAASPGFFAMLGVEPVQGRGFEEREGIPDGDKVVILSHGLWQRRFGGSPNVVGERLVLDEVGHTVVGVLPPSFYSPTGLEEECWRPLQISATSTPRRVHNLTVFGRLAPGVGLDGAQEEMSGIMRRLEEEYPDTNRGRGAQVVPLTDELLGAYRPSLGMLLAAVAVLLLIALVNVLGLMAMRGLEQQQKVAISVALGARRRHVVAQALVEGLLLASLGAVVGVLLAIAGLRVLVHLAPYDMPRLDAVGLDPWVLGLTLVVTVGAGLLIGIVPALRFAGLDVQALLQPGAGVHATGGRAPVRRLLVVAEIGLSLVLLVAAGLLLGSFHRLRNVEMGFRAQQAVTMELTLPRTRYPFSWSHYPEWPELIALYNGFFEATRSAGGYESASLAVNHPLRPGWTTPITLDDRPEPPTGEADEVRFRPVAPGYFRATGSALLRGRSFTHRDDAAAPRVIVVNQAFVDRYYDGDPLGKSVTAFGRSREIVGVVEDVRFMGLGEPAPPALYTPFLQTPPTGSFVVVARAKGDPASALRELEEAIHSVDPNLALFNVDTLDTLVARSLARPRFNSLLLTFFAGAALLLTVVGLYGLINQSVIGRMRELGIRMALGGQRSSIRRLVLAEGLTLLGAGIVVGLVAALALARLLRSLIFEIGTVTFGTYAGAAGVMLLVGILACVGPMFKAVRAEVASLLRTE